MKDKITQQYINHVLEHGEKPKSIYAFAQALDMEESAFYEHFSTFEAIEAEVFKSLFERTVANLEQQEVYAEYSAREKMLAFFYGWVEQLKGYRSFINFLHTPRPEPRLTPVYLKTFKEAFVGYARQLIKEGMEQQEISDRKYLSERYPEALWLEVLFVLNYWLNDHSKGFERTDEAVEKSVNLAFDLMGRSAIDTAFEFGKFLFQKA